MNNNYGWQDMLSLIRVLEGCGIETLQPPVVMSQDLHAEYMYFRLRMLSKKWDEHA
jgi:hypothetical protein